MKSEFFSETSVDLCRSTRLKFSEEMNFNYCCLASEKFKSLAVMTCCTRVIFSSGVSIFLTLQLKLQNSVPKQRILRLSPKEHTRFLFCRYWNWCSSECYWPCFCETAYSVFK